MKRFSLLDCTIWCMLGGFIASMMFWVRALLFSPPQRFYFPNIEVFLPSLQFAQENTSLLGGVAIGLDLLAVIGAVFLFKRKKWAHSLVVTIVSLLFVYNVVHIGLVYFEIEALLANLTPDWQDALQATLETKARSAFVSWVTIVACATTVLGVLLKKTTVVQLVP